MRPVAFFQNIFTDMVEVIKAFCHLNNLEWEAVLGAAERKQEERGGFYQGIILQEVK